MKSEDLEKITSSITQKLGEENSALISDDLGILITQNNNILSDMENKDNEIKQLKEEKEKLVLANGNLLKNVTMTREKIDENDEHESSSNFNFYEAFDEKGNFKK